MAFPRGEPPPGREKQHIATSSTKHVIQNHRAERGVCFEGTPSGHSVVIDRDREVLNLAAQRSSPGLSRRETVRYLSCRVGVVVWFFTLVVGVL